MRAAHPKSNPNPLHSIPPVMFNFQMKHPTPVQKITPEISLVPLRGLRAIIVLNYIP
jgi:hypothetical protein